MVTSDLEARYVRHLRRRHPIQAWLADWRRWRARRQAAR